VSPASGACELKIADVDTRDKQHKSHGAQQKPEIRPHFVNQFIPQRHDGGASALVGVGISRGQIAGDLSHIGLRCCQRHAGLQSPDCIHALVDVAVIEEGIFGLADGNVHILDAGKVEGAEVEAGGQYADDGVSVAVS